MSIPTCQGNFIWQKFIHTQHIADKKIFSKGCLFWKGTTTERKFWHDPFNDMEKFEKRKVTLNYQKKDSLFYQLGQAIITRFRQAVVCQARLS